jgi:hypothetical protein
MSAGHIRRICPPHVSDSRRTHSNSDSTCPSRIRVVFESYPSRIRVRAEQPTEPGNPPDVRRIYSSRRPPPPPPYYIRFKPASYPSQAGQGTDPSLQARTHTRTRAHARTHTHARAHAHARPHMHARTPCARARTHIRTCTRTHAHAHEPTHLNAYTRAHTHTHTHQGDDDADQGF